jgi:hypothetical protein
MYGNVYDLEINDIYMKAKMYCVYFTNMLLRILLLMILRHIKIFLPLLSIFPYLYITARCLFVSDCDSTVLNVQWT